MKKKIIITIAVASTIIASFLLGTTQSKTTIITKEVETIPTGYINTSSDDFCKNYIDMRKVTNFSANEYGLQLQTSDGNSYWYEK